jgi:phospholipid/cholesterol/gamma-HCH transport system ATP-binding protein
MNRRAALARAIALDPSLIIYDEPFAGQDPIVKGVLVTLIRTLREALGMTTIIVSHDIHETLSIADYIYVLAGGKVIGEGTPEALRDTDSPLVKQFLNGLPDGPVRFRYPAASFAEELQRQTTEGGR